MKVTRVQETKINSVDFENLVFGKTFTDHMFLCHFRDGKWQTPEIKPYQALTLDPSASVLHYGQAVFEGKKHLKTITKKCGYFVQRKTLNELISLQSGFRFQNFQSRTFLKD